MGLKFVNLMSFALYKGESSLAGLHPEWDTMLDSGGFTNFTTGKDVVTLEGYTYFLKKHGRRFWKYLALDRIGDKRTSERWLQHLKNQKLNPVPIFQRGEADAQDLITMLKNNWMVCIGGISQNLQDKREQDYLASVMKVVYSVPAQRVHLLGVGIREAKLYNPFSADSSTWAGHARFGVLRLWHQGKLVSLNMHKSAVHKDNYIRPNPNNTKMLLKYGLTWDELYNRKNWSDCEGKIYVAVVRSWMRQCLALRRKGCRYVLAHFKSQIPCFREAWNYERTSWGWDSKVTYSLPPISNFSSAALIKPRKQKSRFTSKKMRKIKK